MRINGLRSPRGLISAIFLGLAGLALGWLCFLVAVVRVLTPTSPQIVQFAAHDPNVVLSKATLALILNRGQPDPALLGNVRRAAAAAPLDARPYLILGRQRLAEGDQRRGIATLEAGQRLDPRQRFIHAFLLEQYLETGQYDKAAAQFSVLARLVGATQQPIAKAVAMMSTVPSMRDPVRRTLHSDPELEKSVLTMMANGDATPADIFDLASPVGIANAGDKDSWGPALVTRLVTNNHFDAAHAVWQRIYHLSDAQVSAPIFNANFQTIAASPPFNWTLASDSLGAADPRRGSLSIEYYGRVSGDLASQLLLLRPGRYRFSFVVEGGKADTASRLSWLLTCATGSKATLMNAAVIANPKAREAAADLVVRADCPAQLLTLHGEAGEFPVPVSTTVRELALRPTLGTRL